MLKTRLSFASVVTGIVFSLAAISAVQAHERQVGVLGLYRVNDPETAVPDEAKVRDLGCAVRRVGIIGTQQGDIGLEQPNHFVFMACGASPLGDAAARAMVRDLISTGRSLAVLEGDLTDLAAGRRDGQQRDAIAARQYIVKISHYNNRDADGRDRDLAALNVESEGLPDTYVNEAFIGVNSAIGLPTPDEVVLLFYDNPATGDRFRKNNPGLLKRIGAFNKAHLSGTIYYGGRAVR